MQHYDSKHQPIDEVKAAYPPEKKSERTGSDAPEQRKSDDQDSKQEEMYKTLIENIPCAVYSAFPGEKGPTTFMSKNWKDWTGYSAEEFYQDPEAWPKCIYPDDREKAVNAYVEACNNEAPYNLEYRIVHRDTWQVRYVRDQGLLNKDTKGTLVRVDGIITDITELKTSENELVKYRDHLEELVKERTAELEKANEVLKIQDTERKEAEESLRESENRYKAVVDNAQEGVVVVQDRMLKFVNPAVRAIIGYTEEELMTRPFIEFVHPDDRGQVMEIHLKRNKGGEVPPVYEFRIVDKQGEIKWMENNGIRIEWEGMPATLNFLRDVTERKKTEAILQKQREELQVILDSVPAGIWYKDSENRLVRVNKAAAVSISMKPEDIEGKEVCELFPKDAEHYYKDDLEVIRSGKPKLNIIEGMQVPWGEKKWVCTDKVPYRDEQGNVSGVIAFVSDITERKKAEAKLLDYQAKLKSLASQLSVTEERERRRIATDLHDHIGQSLVFSKLKLDELQHSTNSSELTKALNEISNNIAQVIQDTRTLTFDLSSPILNEIGFETAVSEWLEEKIKEKHGIKTEFEDDGQAKLLDDDIRALLFRNVRELLVNVVKHAKAHNVKISISKVDSQICVSVEDDGVGFKSAEVTSLASENDRFGIFSIKERLEQLGGYLEIDSEKDRGSKITMTAPLKLTNSQR